MQTGLARQRITAHFISYGSIFFPINSGVRPTIRPAIKTLRITKAKNPYSPLPAPPKTTSPTCIRIMQTIDESGLRELSDRLLEPLEAAVVETDHKAEGNMPIRTSFPSMLPNFASV